MYVLYLLIICSERHNSILNWMRSNRLQLNAYKTKLIWRATPSRLPLLPVIPIIVGSGIISPTSLIRDLRVYIDADLSMRTHVEETTASCFAAVHQIRSVQWWLPPSAIKTLVSLVLSRLDNGNTGIPAYLLRRLQFVLNAVARINASLTRSVHRTLRIANEKQCTHYC